MDALLRSLENESLLLMYLAGELPEEDRHELEALLATDGGLRSQLQALRDADETMTSLLSESDTAAPLRSPESAVRRLSRDIRQWQVDRFVRPAEKPAATRRMIWVYPIATAAAIAIGFCIWWGMRPDTLNNYAATQPIQSPALAVNPNDPSPTDQPASALPERHGLEIVGLDRTAQPLADLERSVGEDLQ